VAIVERRVLINGITVNVALDGPEGGPPVLLLHGFPDRWSLWRHQIPALAAAGYRVVAPDLRGFGESDRPAEVADYAMRTLVGDVTGLLDERGLAQARVVGHDWGAGLAWSVANAVPHRVSSLAVLSVGHGYTKAAAGAEQRQRSWYMLWFLFPGVAEQVMPEHDWRFLRDWAWNGMSTEDTEQQIRDLSRPGALTAALNWYRANIDPARYVMLDAPQRFRPVTCPTMGIWSTDDPTLGETQMKASADYVTGPWRYERVEGVGHWIPVLAPDRVNELLLDFFKEH
jgi:pimeloyl-ACP methyl ester carboxylesterase